MGVEGTAGSRTHQISEDVNSIRVVQTCNLRANIAGRLARAWCKPRRHTGACHHVRGYRAHQRLSLSESMSEILLRAGQRTRNQNPTTPHHNLMYTLCNPSINFLYSIRNPNFTLHNMHQNNNVLQKNTRTMNL
jgi:hypothetical protein